MEQLFLNNKTKHMKKLFILLTHLFIFASISIDIYQRIEMNKNCIGYLKQAADANTINVAKAQLSKSLNYLEKNSMTTGYTSILYNTPNEDVGFWYSNLKISYNELSKIDSNSSSLEKTNILMKLRETILDNNEKGDSVTVPPGLARYPYNLLWAIINVISFLLTLFLIFRSLVKTKTVITTSVEFSTKKEDENSVEQNSTKYEWKS